MKTALRRKASKAYASILNVYDKLTARKVEVCLADFMLNQGYIDSLQFLLASRIIDVENYCINGDNRFELTNTISKAAYPERDESFFLKTNKVFISLIDSIKEKGFNNDCPIKLDDEYRITDGTHRIAICYNANIFKINALVLKRSSKNQKSPEPYYSKKNLNSELLDIVLEKNNEIQRELVKKGYCFCLYAENGEEIAKDIKGLAVVKETYVKENKLLIKFVLNNPEYFISNGVILSKKASFIEKLLQIRHTQSKLVLSKNCSEGFEIFNKYCAIFI